MRKGLLFVVAALFTGFGALAQTYCAAGPSSTADSDVRDVVLTGDNYGISQLNTCPGVAGAQDNTALDSADVSLGTSYSLQVVFSSCSGFYYNGAGQAWIDWNDNGTFESTESLGAGVSFTNAQQPYTHTFNFTVPMTATLGRTRIRVMQWEGGALPLNPCGSYTWGSVEDYTIRVTNTPPACPIPGSLNATAITSTGATLNWSSTGTSFNLEYGPTGFTPGTGTLVTGLTTTSYVLSTLSPQTTYQFIVQNNCTASGNGTSGWSNAGSFTTLCGVNATPYTQNFTGTAPGFQAQWANNCWESKPGVSSGLRWESEDATGANENSTGTGPFYDNTTPAAAGGIYMYLETSSGTTGDTASLVSPPINLAGLTTPFVQFYYHMYGATMGTLQVLAQGTNGAWTQVWSLTGQQQVAGSDPFNLDGALLTAFAGQTIRLKFRGVRGSSFTGDMSVDDISVQEAPACPWPSNLTAYDITGTTALMTWLGNSSSYNVEWGPCGYTQGTGTAAVATNDSLAITGLTGNTCYHVYVQSNCGVNGNSLWIGPYSFTTAIVPDWIEPFVSYLPPNSPARWNEAQGNLANPTVFASFNPTASGWSQDGWLNNGFTGSVRQTVSGTTTDEWIITPPIDLGVGNNYQLEYDIAATSAGGTGTATWSTDDSVMVVISTDGTWSRSNAIKVYHSGNTVGNAGLHDVFNLSAYSGVIQIGFYAESSVTNSSWDLHLDNVEVRTPPACPAPFAIVTDSIGTNAIGISWNASGNYTVEWGPEGYVQGTGSTASITNDSSLLATGLMSATTYDFYVQSICGPGVVSQWTGPYTVSTLCDTFALPYSYGFENSVAIPGQPLCWDWTNGTSYWQTNSGVQSFNRQPRTGNNYLQVRWTSGSNEYAFTPEFNLQGNTSYQFSFWYNTDGLSGWEEISAYFGTAQNVAGMTFQIGSPIIAPNNTTYQQFVGTFIPPATGRYHLGIKVRSNGVPWYVSIDDLNLSLDPNPCPAPASLSVSNLIDTAATLNWASLTSITNFNVEWGPQGFIQGSMTSGGTMINNISGNSTVLDTLSGNTCYDFYVQGICAGGTLTSWTGPFTFCTPCSPFTAPFFDNFDSYPSFAMPDCYTKVTIGPTTFANVQTTTFPAPPTSPNQMELYNYNHQNPGDVTALISPDFSDLPVGDKRIKMLVSTSNNSNTLIVGTVPSPGAMAQFDPIDTLTGLTNVANQRIVQFTTASGYNGTDRYIAFVHGNQASFTDVYIDNFTYEVIPTCPEPLSGSTTNITDVSAQTNWVPAGTATYSQVSYGPTATTPNPAAGTVITVTSATSQVISSLMSNTNYSWWVRDSCAANDLSQWTGPFTFRTLCSAFNAPYFTTWTGVPAGLSGDPGNCWTLGNGSSSTFFRWETEDATGANENSSGTGPFWDHTSFGTPGGMYIYLETSSGSANDSAFVESPLINLTGLTNPQLTFAYHMYGATMGNLRVDIWNNGAWTNGVFTANGQQQTAGNQPWMTTAVSLTSYTGNIKIRFKGTRGTSFTGDMSLDDIRVDEVPPCASPFALNATAITDTSATLTWTDSISSTTFYVEYGPSGFTPGTGTSVTVTTDSLNIIGLMNNSGYCFYVAGLCPGGADTSLLVGPYCFTTNCGVVIGDVLTNPFVVNTNPYVHSNSTATCYTNTIQNPSPDVYYQVTTGPGATAISADLCNPNTSYDSYIRLLDATGTQIVGDDDGCASPGLASQILNYPVTPGTVYYILVEGFGSGSGNYTLTIDIAGQTPTCVDPSGLSVVATTCNSAELTWTQGGDDSRLEYGPVGFTPGTGTMVPTATPNYTINGLMPGTTYDVYVQDTCNGIGTSAWVGPVAVTTAPNDVLASFVATMTGSTAASMTFGFDASGSQNGTTYDWDFGNGTTGSGVNASVTYVTNGVYNVTLTVTGPCGTDDTTIAVNASIGVEEQIGLSGLSLYPNPTSGVFNLEMMVVDAQDVQITLFNGVGQELSAETIEQAQGTVRKNFDLTGYAKGVYLVRIATEKGSVIQRISLQ